MSRTKLAIYNMCGNIGLQAVIVTCGLIVPPLIISTFGSEINGLVSTIKQLLTYFSVVSLGLGAASSVALYEPLAKKDYNRVSAVFSATRIFFNQTGYAFGGLVLLTAIVLPLLKAGNIPPFTIFWLVLILGTGGFLEYIIVTKYRLLLIADQKLYIAARINAEGSILNAIAIVVLIKLGYSIIWVQLAASGIYLYRLLLTVHWVKKCYPQLRIKATPDFQAISKRWQAFHYQLPGLIITYTPILIIAAFCGYVEASVYAVYNTIFAALTMIVNIFSAALAPTFGNLIVDGNKALLEKNFRIYETVYWVALSFCCIGAAILAVPFVSLYIKSPDHVNYLVPSVAICFSLRVFCYALRTPSVTLVDAKGLFKENRKANMYEAIFNIILSLILVLYWGIAGVLAAGALTGAIRSIGYMANTEKLLPNNQFLKHVWLCSGYLLAGVLFYLLLGRFTVHTWLGWLLQACLRSMLIGIALIVLASCFNLEEIKAGIKKIKSLY